METCCSFSSEKVYVLLYFTLSLLVSQNRIWNGSWCHICIYCLSECIFPTLLPALLHRVRQHMTCIVTEGSLRDEYTHKENIRFITSRCSHFQLFHPATFYGMRVFWVKVKQFLLNNTKGKWIMRKRTWIQVLLLSYYAFSFGKLYRLPAGAAQHGERKSVRFCDWNEKKSYDEQHNSLTKKEW